MRSIVDPRFGATLRRLREQRGLSLRALARAAYASSSHLHDLETGRRRPTPDTAQRLDDVLRAGGELAGMVRDPAADLNPDDHDRLDVVTVHPRQTDPAALDALAALLAAQRRIEDVLGSAAVVSAASAQLDVVTALAGSAHDRLRPRLIGLAAQWAQFVGWLHIAAADRRGADRWLGRALEWATELGDRDLAGTALSFRAMLAEDAGQLGAMIGLSRVAAVDPAVHISQRAYDWYQLARGLARVGDLPAALNALAAADDTASAAAADTGPVPAWHYYRDATFFQLESGRAAGALAVLDPQHAGRAVELLRAGLAGLPSETRHTDWVGSYVVDLVRAYDRVGARPEADEALDEARQIAAVTRSGRLLGQVDAAVRNLSAAR
nr:helix-turn-helix transcriptional regulator [Micromonospora sp. DSM 115978]